MQSPNWTAPHKNCRIASIKPRIRRRRGEVYLLLASTTVQAPSSSSPPPPRLRVQYLQPTPIHRYHPSGVNDRVVVDVNVTTCHPSGSRPHWHPSYDNYFPSGHRQQAMSILCVSSTSPGYAFLSKLFHRRVIYSALSHHRTVSASRNSPFADNEGPLVQIDS